MQPITGAISAIEDSKSGKALRVQVNGQWFSSKDFGIRDQVGTVITFTPSSSEYRGKTYWWINDYNVGTTGTTRAASPAAAPAATNNEAMAFLPMTSNLVAHAIAAGRIETPEQIAAWARAAFNAAKNLVTNTDEDFDDDIPF
jgi:hypothetical protein